MKLYHIRNEGEPIKQGINVYPKNSKSSKGCVIRLWNFSLWIRYSLWSKRWIIKLIRYNMSEKEYEEWCQRI